MNPDQIAKALAEEVVQIVIPDPLVIDLGPLDVASLVARSSNSYGAAIRLAGMARVEAKKAKGKYEMVVKRNRHGSNDAERSANAAEAAEADRLAWMDAEEVAVMAECAESAARVASESARKLLDKIEQLGLAAAREAAGAYRDADFQPY